MVTSLRSGHGRRHGDSRIGEGGGRVEPLELPPNTGADSGDSLRCNMGGVEGVKDNFDTELLVLAVQLRKAVVVADQGTAQNAVDVPDAEMTARAVML